MDSAVQLGVHVEAISTVLRVDLVSQKLSESSKNFRAILKKCTVFIYI